MMFDLSLYNDEFFEWHLKHARGYSIKTMDWYIQKYKPSSVIDFGCGIGSYLESAQKHGLHVRGIDISKEAKKFTPKQLHDWILYFDCTKPMQFADYDTVLSFETAEHIDPKGTQQFIDNLIYSTGKHLLFTAAPPGQQGTGHINLHPREFWIYHLTEGLKYSQELTTDIADNWRRLGAPNYICDNLIVCTR